MTKVIRVLVLLLVLLATPISGWAEDTWSILFDSEFRSELKSNSQLIYEQAEIGEKSESVDLKLNLLENGNSNLIRMENQRERKIGGFDQSIGNPVVLYFLEETVKGMSALTKGSPYYIRNRIMDSIIETETSNLDSSEYNFAGLKLHLVPFKDDKNQAKLGKFAELSITVVISDNVPGGIHSIVAKTPKRGNALPFFRIVKFREIGPPQ